jgi:hypothetical protein
MRTLCTAAMALTMSLSASASAAVVGVGGFFTDDDGMNHALVATDDGRVIEIYWPYTRWWMRSDVLYQFDKNITAVTGYYSKYDGYRHADVALIDGSVWEIFFRPDRGIFVDRLFDAFDYIRSLHGYYSDSDGFQHLLFPTSGGSVFEYRFNPYCSSSCGGTNYGFHYIATVPAGALLTGFYSFNDQYEHLIALENVSSPTGVAIQEYFWKGGSPKIFGGENLPDGNDVLTPVVSIGAATEYHVDQYNQGYWNTIMMAQARLNLNGMNYIEEYVYSPIAGHVLDSVEPDFAGDELFQIASFRDPLAGVVWDVVATEKGYVYRAFRSQDKQADGNFHYYVTYLAHF